MKVRSRMFQGMCLVALSFALNGCGSSSSSSDETPAPTTTSQTTTVTSAQVAAPPASAPAGSIAVAATQPLEAAAPLQTGATKSVTAVTIPASATIIPPAGVTFSTTTPPVIVVSTPVDNATAAASGLPRVTPATGAAFTVASSNGAVDVSISGAGSFTLSTPATVNIPVNAVLTNPVTVYSVKANGTTSTLSGTYSVDTNGNKIVTVLTSDFCWFIVKPVPVVVPTGSTGGSQ